MRRLSRKSVLAAVAAVVGGTSSYFAYSYVAGKGVSGQAEKQFSSPAPLLGTTGEQIISQGSSEADKGPHGLHEAREEASTVQGTQQIEAPGPAASDAHQVDHVSDLQLKQKQVSASVGQNKPQEPAPADSNVENDAQSQSASQNVKVKAQRQQQQQAKAQSVTDSRQKSEQTVKPAQKSESQPIKKPIRQAHTYKKLSEIPQLNTNSEFGSDEYAFVVLDMPYTPAFEEEILKKLSTTMKNRRSSRPLSIYRVNASDPKNHDTLVQKFGATLKEDTVLLLKSPYDSKLINIDFDIYIQQAAIPSIYLSELKVIDSRRQLQKQMTRMTDNDTFLIYTIPFDNGMELAKRKLMAKYIEMELGSNRIDNIKVYVVEEKLAKEAGIVSHEAKPNSLHLVRKHNDYTFKTPNKTLFDAKQGFHVMESISFYDKAGRITLPRYMGKIETFTGLQLDSPFACSVVIDRNRITPQEQKQVLKVFADLKAAQEFPSVSFVLKYAETDYRGEKEQPFSNKKFAIVMANLQELDKASMIHEIRAIKDAESLGINERNWLRNSNEYLFKEPEVTAEGVRNFITRVLEGKEPQFYKSEAKFKLQKIKKVTGDTFQQIVLNPSAEKSHLVFEYSDSCQTCQVLAPGVQFLNQVYEQHPQIKIEVNALNCDKNKVKGQLYTPYTPSLNFYSRNWRNTSPIKYPILDYINHTGIWGIYQFCKITDQLKQVELKKFEEQIRIYTQNRIRLTDF